MGLLLLNFVFLLGDDGVMYQSDDIGFFFCVSLYFLKTQRTRRQGAFIT